MSALAPRKRDQAAPAARRTAHGPSLGAHLARVVEGDAVEADEHARAALLVVQQLPEVRHRRLGVLLELSPGAGVANRAHGVRNALRSLAGHPDCVPLGDNARRPRWLHSSERGTRPQLTGRRPRSAARGRGTHSPAGEQHPRRTSSFLGRGVEATEAFPFLGQGAGFRRRNFAEMAPPFPGR